MTVVTVPTSATARLTAPVTRARAAPRTAACAARAAPTTTARPGRARPAVTAAAASATYGTTPALNVDAYVVLGLANCFEKDEEGKLNPRQVVEPVSANTLESLAAGAKTSYSEVWATTAGAVAGRDRSTLPPAWAGAAFCTDWEARLGAVARTWARPHAVDNLMDIVPLGQARSGWNTSTEDKRVLNFIAEVNDDDNIKQDISIDVYGRAAPDADKVLGTDSPAAARAAKAAAKAAEDGAGGGAKPRAAAEKAAPAAAKAAAPAAVAAAAAAAAAAPAAAPAPPPPAPVEEEEEEDDLDALLNA